MSEIERTSVTTWKRDEQEEEKKGEYNIQKKKGRRIGVGLTHCTGKTER